MKASREAGDHLIISSASPSTVASGSSDRDNHWGSVNRGTSSVAVHGRPMDILAPPVDNLPPKMRAA
jgi:hypothetical protein